MSGLENHGFAWRSAFRLIILFGQSVEMSTTVPDQLWHSKRCTDARINVMISAIQVLIKLNTYQKSKELGLEHCNKAA